MQLTMAKISVSVHLDTVVCNGLLVAEKTQGCPYKLSSYLMKVNFRASDHPILDSSS